MADRKTAVSLKALTDTPDDSAELRPFETKPTQVFAIQFQGWHNAQKVYEAHPHVFYVPEGFDHPLRMRSTVVDGPDKGDTAEFLVLFDEGQQFRLDLWSWIVLDSEGKFSAMNNDKFHEIFREVQND